MKKNYTIGLDLGINNVGWAIIDNKDNSLSNYGVRLFRPAMGAQDRRVARNTRRRMKRRDTRLDDTKKLLKEILFPSETIIDSKLLEKRVTALTAKVDKQDITNILCYMVSHRGYIPYGDEEVKNAQLNVLLPCQYYMEEYKKTGKYRASEYTVRAVDNFKEMEQMIKTQGQYYPELNLEFINKYSVLFNRKRKYWEGPGSITKFTPFGRFKNKQDAINYNLMKEKDSNYEKYIYEDLIGHCKIEPTEKCAPKGNFYAEKYNLINDFINCSFNSIDELNNKECFNLSKNGLYKLNKIGLEKIVNYCMENENLTYPSIFKKIFNTNIKNVVGYPIDKNDKPNFNTLNTYRIFLKKFKASNLSINWLTNLDVYNSIIKLMTVAPGSEEFKKAINNNLAYNFNELEIEVLTAIQMELKSKMVLSYHSLSEMILKRAITDMLDLEMNFMQVSRLKDYEKKSREEFIKKYDESNLKNHMSSKFIDELIAAPQVKKTLRQAIKIINAIIDSEKELPTIIAIESTKEMNGKDKQELINDYQRKQENLRKASSMYLRDNYGNEAVTTINIEKFMLYIEVEGQCPYCGASIYPNDLLSDSYHIEHILPKSKSFDNSFNNKTIACSKCNENKGNKTPYQYLNGDALTAFIERVSNNKKITRIKKQNLLFNGNIDKYTTRFFNRNLRDTAYATSELINQVNIFNLYLQYKEKDVEIKTLSTPGQLTYELRKRNKLDKDRNNGKFHHAVDAAIIASIPITDIGKVMVEAQNSRLFWKENKNHYVDSKEMVSSINLKETIDEIKKIEEANTKYSYQVIKDPQGKLSNANVYKAIVKDGTYYKIEQINNIYELENDKKLFKELLDIDNHNKTLLCYDNNMEQFTLLKDIYEKYEDEKEPFVAYLLETGKKELQVPTKKGNGPAIKRLRYYQKINDPYQLNKKNIKKKDSNILVLDSLAQFCTRVFYDADKKKFVFLPIYSIMVDLNTKKINENNAYYKLFFDKYIGEKCVEHVVDLYNGNFIEVVKNKVDAESGYNIVLSGEYQYYNKPNNKVILKNGNALTPSDLKFTVIDFDVLGNKRIRLTYPRK